MAWTFGPAVPEEYSPVVFAGGEVTDTYPLVVVVRYSAECLAYSWLSQIQRECLSCLSQVVSSQPFFWEGCLGCGRSGHWPAVSPSGLGGNLADFDRGTSTDSSYSPGRNPGG